MKLEREKQIFYINAYIWNLDRSSNQSILKEINPKYFFIERTDVEAEAPVLGYLMQRADSLEKTLMLGKIEGRRRSNDRG